MYSYLNLMTKPLVSNPIRAFRLILQSRRSSISHDCGIEALFFDRYLRFLAMLFGSSALVLAPTLAVFNYVAGTSDRDLDFLARLSWTSLAPDHPRYYWAHVSFVPIFVAFCFWMITCELQQALLLRRQTGNWSREVEPSCFYVAISNLPSHLQDEKELRALCAHWKHQIVLLSFVNACHKAETLAERLRGLIRHIERRETAFIHQILQTPDKQNSGEKLADCLERVMGERHFNTSDGGYIRAWLRETLSGWIPYCIQPIDWLYSVLLKTVRSRQDLFAAIKKRRKRAALIGLRHQQDARSFGEHLQSYTAANSRVEYLGSNLDQILVSSIPESRVAAQARSGMVNLVMAAVIMLWTIPVGANGFASQVSSALPLLYRGEDWHIPIWLTGILQGVLPQITTYFVMSSILLIVRFLVARKGHLTSIDVQLSTQRFYFWVLYVLLFVTTSLSSGLIPTLVKLMEGNAAQLPRILARNLPLASTYYLSYLALHLASQSVFMLVRIPSIVKLYARLGRCETPKDQIDALNDLHFVVRWGEIYPVYSTIGVIGESHVPW